MSNRNDFFDAKIKLNKARKEGTLMKSIVPGSHYNAKHRGMNVPEMIDRTINLDHSRRKVAATTFNRDENPDELVSDIILKKRLNDVAKWLADPEADDRLALSVDTGRKTGHGVRLWHNALEHFETSEVSIVLQKNQESCLGFSLLTAYPSTKDFSNMDFTGKDLTMALHKTNSYKHASPKDKEYFDRCAEKGTTITHDYRPPSRGPQMPVLTAPKMTEQQAGFA